MSQYLDTSKQNISNVIPSGEAVSSTISNTLANAQSTVASAKESINATLNDFSSKTTMNASSEFLNSNSVIAKFVFLILVLIVFLFLLRVGSAIVVYLMSPSKQPYLAKGVTKGTVNMTIPQDPANSNSPVIYRSNNQTGGIEYTWSTWLWVDSIGTTQYKQSHIFHKGNDQYNVCDAAHSTNGGVATVNNGPGLYLGVDSNNRPTNSLVFYFDAEKQISTPDPVKLEIVNIPLKKWFHVAYRFQNFTIDCYVNGVLAKSVPFGEYVPKQNNDDLHIGKNGGFDGSLSNLRYYDYALSAFDIAAIANAGPNLNANKQSGTANNSIFDYISLGWYSSFR
jgi:hypothetical protein